MFDKLRDDFEERLQEIETYLDLLDMLEKQVRLGPPMMGESTISAQQQKILYSSVYLQLYNLVEATVHWCLKAVCSAASTPGTWRPRDLSEKLLREWTRVYARTHEDLNHDNRLSAVLALCKFMIEAQPLPDFNIERRSNWDDLEIETVSARIGCELQISHEVRADVKRHVRDDKGALVLIKDLRNRLGHGSLSFTECGDGATVEDLRDLKEHTARYLREVVDSFGRHVKDHLFLLPASRP